MSRISTRVFASLLVLWLTACSVVDFSRPGNTTDEASYVTLNPFYIEYCALSQILKRPGFGANIRGEIGGHAVFYLNGACIDAAANYPVLRLCDIAPNAPSEGVGISVNAHFRNAKWVATQGRAFFFTGNLDPGARLTAEAYGRVQAEAQRRGIYRGVAFHRDALADMPAGMSEEAYKYEISVATDYAVALGRGRFCARVPVTRAQLHLMVDFLNAQNAPYRSGAEEFHWSLFQDNCIHLAHNALAAAGIGEEWPVNRFIMVAIFDFPVPRNEFVNLMRLTNELDLQDLLALYRRTDIRNALSDFNELPWRPGALAESQPPISDNDIYETALKLIFYDEPNFGSYQAWADRIASQPRYHRLPANLAHFAAAYAEAIAARQPVEAWLSRAGFAAAEAERFKAFHASLYRHLESQLARVTAQLAALRTPPRPGAGLR
jgi:hypothetical protein